MKPKIAPGVRRWFVTEDGHRFGSGWISGTIGAVCGLAGMFGSASFAWPHVLTVPSLREFWPATTTTLLVGLVALAFPLGALSLVLRRKKTLGVIALSSAVVGAALLALAPRHAVVDGGFGFGVDVLALNLLIYSALFVPMERLWPRLPTQPTFRDEWWTDLAWFASSALLVQLTTWVVLTPGVALAQLVPDVLQRGVGSLPLVLQLIAIVVVADLVQYWVHFACHRVPWLWRFHAIHHSAREMDWLAGSRLHILDALLTRALVYAAIAMLGFELRAIGIYLVIVAAQATFVHANVSWRLRWLEPYLVTPRFHHWHHAVAPQDVNFAVHLPWLDRLFGTFHLPEDRWPEHIGLADGARAPRGFWRQLLTLS
ncbi:MAG: sterol desaturase family protein [Planctomycetota bacterium]